MDEKNFELTLRVNTDLVEFMDKHNVNIEELYILMNIYSTHPHSLSSHKDFCIELIQKGFVKIIKDSQEKEVEEKVTFYEEFLEKFRNLFPEGIRNGGNAYLRGNKADIERKMNKFLNRYKIDFETILKATESFISKFSFKGDYKFCPTAEYFILKDNKSTLATECEAIKEAEKRGEGDAENFDSFTHQLM